MIVFGGGKVRAALSRVEIQIRNPKSDMNVNSINEPGGARGREQIYRGPRAERKPEIQDRITWQIKLAIEVRMRIIGRAQPRK